MILQFMWRREFPLHWTYLLKTLQVPWLTHLLFLFRDLNVHHHNDWLTYSDETDTYLVNCYNLTWPYSDDWLPYSDPCDFHSPALLDLLSSSDASMFYNGFLYFGKFCYFLSFHWLSVKLKRGGPISSHTSWLFLCWLGWFL